VNAPSAAAPAIELTFDDGPDPVWTPAVLRALDAIGARATFYVVAPLAREQAALVRSAAAAGHEIGLQPGAASYLSLVPRGIYERRGGTRPRSSRSTPPTTSSTGWAWPPRTAPWPARDSGRRQPPGATGWPIPITFPSLSRNHAARSPAPPLLG
jgi:Polysaccharide deacetylase